MTSAQFNAMYVGKRVRIKHGLANAGITGVVLYNDWPERYVRVKFDIVIPGHNQVILACDTETLELIDSSPLPLPG